MRIKLTAIDKVLKESSEEKIFEQYKDTDNINWEDLGINPPPEDDQVVELTEEDYEYLEAECEIESKSINLKVNNIDRGTTIYLDSAVKVTVAETIEEINRKNKNFFQRLFGL